MVRPGVRAFSLFLVTVVAVPSFAADRQKIAALNVGATSLLTLASCLVQRHVQSARDAFRCLGIGAVAGTGFYQAKRAAARGDITRGWLIANAASSMVENTAAGEHPLSRLGYTFGPLRLRVVTPFDERRESYLDVDVSAAESGFLMRAINDADDFDIRDGMLWYETAEPDVDEEGRVFHGYTWGIFPGTWSNAEEHTWNHEAVHAVQSLQLDSIDPPALVLQRTRAPVRLRYLRAGALNVTDNILMAQRPYETRWAEIEAYRLTEDRRPPR